MKKPSITDIQAEKLIKMLKLVLKRYLVKLDLGAAGEINLCDELNKYRFTIYYEVSNKVPSKMHIHIREKTIGVNLFRVNMDPNGFHKNSSGEIIKGNRIMKYSMNEWYAKDDGVTYFKAYPLPVEAFPIIDSLVAIFKSFLSYTNEQRVNQMLERSIISEDVIDVFDTLGLKQPEISLLDEQFLQEVRTMKTRNLAREMLKKLLEGEIKSMARTNLVKSELFSEKLRKSLNKYRNQSITNAEVIEELIRMADEIRKMSADEAKLGLNKDEIAFYYALSKDKVVRDFYTDDTLKKIVQELTATIRNNVTIDFNIREQAQAMMRIHIRRLLKKYDYPPEQAKNALEIVMKQVNLMSGNEAPDEETYDGMLGAQTAAEDKENYHAE
nr:DUF3387 domain-containing protein [Sporolactobacillus shoreae]